MIATLMNPAFSFKDSQHEQQHRHRQHRHSSQSSSHADTDTDSDISDNDSEPTTPFTTNQSRETSRTPSTPLATNRNSSSTTETETTNDTMMAMMRTRRTRAAKIAASAKPATEFGDMQPHQPQMQQRQQRQPPHESARSSSPTNTCAHTHTYTSTSRIMHDDRAFLRSAMQSPSKRSGAKKSVSFTATTPKIVMIPTPSEYTYEEFTGTWYTPKEYAAMKQEMQDVIITYNYLLAAATNNNNNSNSNKHLRKLCMRGLETTYGKALQHKTQRRMKHLYAILTIQQQIASRKDAENMASFSQSLTSTAVSEAIVRGKNDEASAVRLTATATSTPYRQRRQ